MFWGLGDAVFVLRSADIRFTMTCKCRPPAVLRSANFKFQVNLSCAACPHHPRVVFFRLAQCPKGRPVSRPGAFFRLCTFQVSGQGANSLSSGSWGQEFLGLAGFAMRCWCLGKLDIKDLSPQLYTHTHMHTSCIWENQSSNSSNPKP